MVETRASREQPRVIIVVVFFQGNRRWAVVAGYGQWEGQGGYVSLPDRECCSRGSGIDEIWAGCWEERVGGEGCRGACECSTALEDLRDRSTGGEAALIEMCSNDPLMFFFFFRICSHRRPTLFDRSKKAPSQLKPLSTTPHPNRGNPLPRATNHPRHIPTAPKLTLQAVWHLNLRPHVRTQQTTPLTMIHTPTLRPPKSQRMTTKQLHYSAPAPPQSAQNTKSPGGGEFLECLTAVELHGRQARTHEPRTEKERLRQLPLHAFAQ